MLTDAVAIVGAGDIAHDPAIDQQRLLAQGHCAWLVQRQATELARDVLLGLDQRLTAQEVPLVQAHGPSQPRLVGVILAVDVTAPQPVALLQPQRVEGPCPAGHQPMRPACLPQQIPKAQPVFDGRVNLPAQFAGIGDAQRQRRHTLDVQRTHAVEGEGGVRYVLLAQLLQDIACPRPPEAERRVLAAHVANVHGAAGGRMLANPGQVVRPHAAAGQNPEAVVLQAADGQVGHDAAAAVAERGVDHRTDRAVDAVGGDRLQEAQRPWPADLDLGKGAQVEQPAAGARRQMFGALDARPVTGRPALPMRNLVVKLFQQAGVGFIPLRHFPAGAGKVDRPLFLQPGMEGSQAQVARLFHLLQGVDDVVDFLVLAVHPRPHVPPGVVVRVKTVDVRLAQVPLAFAAGHQLRNRLTHPARMRHPHAQRRPQPTDARLTDDGVEVVAKCHVAVEGAHEPFALERGQQFIRRRLRYGEVLRRKGALRTSAHLVAVQQQRFVAVVAHRVAVVPLAIVERVILVAQDGVGDKPLAIRRQFGERLGIDKLVLHPQQRETQPHLVRQHRGPHIGAKQHELALDQPLIGEHRACPTVAHGDIQHLDVALELDAGIHRRLRQCSRTVPAAHIGIGGHIVAAKDGAVVQDRDVALDLFWCQQVALQAVAQRHPLLALQFLPARRRRRHLNPTHLVDALLAGVVQRLEQVHRVPGELRHHLGIVGLEDQPWRVRGRAAGFKQRPLVQHQDVMPTKLGQVIRRAAAGDPCAHDHHSCVRAHRHFISLLS